MKLFLKISNVCVTIRQCHGQIDGRKDRRLGAAIPQYKHNK